ncbi:MAG TPA: biopolymer transporter ExbD [Vicinamibacterales bacterium]|nr:biopolymer transporter ExbD [Vicinamibacterales bacterium]
MPKLHHADASGGNGRPGRRGRGARVATTLSEINVIPLVDIMLVLLIIFMVTAPMMQQGLNVNLPRARRAQPVAAEPVYVTVPRAFREDRRVQLDREMVRLDMLAERIRQALLTREDKAVYLRGDAEVTLQELMLVMDQLRAGGVEKVGIVSQPPER